MMPRAIDQMIDQPTNRSINPSTNQQGLLVRCVIAVKGSVTAENFFTS
jgi:hypothetical protein